MIDFEASRKLRSSFLIYLIGWSELAHRGASFIVQEQEAPPDGTASLVPIDGLGSTSILSPSASSVPFRRVPLPAASAAIKLGEVDDYYPGTSFIVQEQEAPPDGTASLVSIDCLRSNCILSPAVASAAMELGGVDDYYYWADDIADHRRSSGAGFALLATLKAAGMAQGKAMFFAREGLTKDVMDTALPFIDWYVKEHTGWQTQTKWMGAKAVRSVNQNREFGMYVAAAVLAVGVGYWGYHYFFGGDKEAPSPKHKNQLANIKALTALLAAQKFFMEKVNDGSCVLDVFVNDGPKLVRKKTLTQTRKDTRNLAKLTMQSVSDNVTIYERETSNLENWQAVFGEGEENVVAATCARFGELSPFSIYGMEKFGNKKAKPIHWGDLRLLKQVKDLVGMPPPKEEDDGD